MKLRRRGWPPPGYGIDNGEVVVPPTPGFGLALDGDLFADTVTQNGYVLSWT